MAGLIATPGATNANSYATVAEADDRLDRRLYTSAWDEIIAPADWQTNAAGTAGDTSIAIDTGYGTWEAGATFTFAGHATEYRVTAELAAAGTLSFAPALTDSVADDEALTLTSTTKKEAVLMWATQVLDETMRWYGSKASTTQALRHPRYGLRDADGHAIGSDVIAPILRDATIEFALVLLGTDKTALPGALGQGLSELQVDTIKLKIDKTFQEAIVPDNILSMLSELGVLEAEASGSSGVVNVMR